VNPETVLVTGASGFVGSAVCKYLLARGYRVRGFVRKTSRWEYPADGPLERAVGDMQDPASLEAAAAGVAWVAHLAGAKSDERDSDRTNVEGASNLIEACRKQQVKFIINVSTQSAKLQRKGTYALTKEAADQVFSTSGFPVTTLRSSLVYGDLTGGVFASLIKFSRLPVIPVMGSGTSPHWPIHVEDLARAIEIAAQRPSTRGQLYELGGPDRANVNELLDAMVRAQGLKRMKLHVPIWAGLAAARVFSVLPRPPFTRSNVLGSNEDVVMDVQRFFRDFDFTPRPLQQGLGELFQRRT
jgi:nucleoside-diphosphate-sugar epimerase